jgi:transcription antitermination factor NusG
LACDLKGEAVGKMEWYVVYTKSKSEKKVDALLNKKGMETYCPLMVSVRQWSDRKVTLEIPVFTSYVFVKIPLSQYNEVRITPGVVNFIYWQGKPALIRESEINAIRQFIAEYGHLSLKINELTRGKNITIPSGIFKDQHAVVKTIKKNKAILELINLQLQLEVRLDLSRTIEPALLN